MADLGLDIAHAVDPVAFAIDRLGWGPDPWQTRAMRSTQPTLLNCSRQSGKSTVTAAIATHEAAYSAGSLTLLIAPTQRQSAILYRKVARFLKSLQPVEQMEIDNKLSCTLKTGSEVVSLPGDPDNLRGYSAPSLIVLDEAAFLSEQMIEAVIPMLAVSEGRLLMLSTPNGRRGYFHEAWTSDDQDWLRIRVPASDCPRIKPAFLEKMRRKMPDYKFRQEFFCEFTDTENQIFGSDLIRSAITDEIAPLFSPAQLQLMGAMPA